MTAAAATATSSERRRRGSGPEGDEHGDDESEEEFHAGESNDAYTNFNGRGLAAGTATTARAAGRRAGPRDRHLWSTRPHKYPAACSPNMRA